jgi:hypothetical protein
MQQHGAVNLPVFRYACILPLDTARNVQSVVLYMLINTSLHVAARSRVVEEKNSVHAASREGLPPKCSQITQKGHCNGIPALELEVSVAQLKVMDFGTANGNKENLAGASLPKLLSIDPSLATDLLEISWGELELKERVGFGTSLPLEFLLNFYVLWI